MTGPPPVVVTGAGSGIGAATTAALAAAGARPVAVGHDPARIAAVGERLGVETHVVEMADLDDVRRLAAALAGRHPRIRALVSSAGVLFGGAVLTGDGNELNMQVNALAPFLLARLLAPALEGGRLVTVGSRSHRWARLDPGDVDDPARAGRAGAARYAASKLAAHSLTHEFARRHPGVAAAVHDPGVVATGLWRHSGVAGRLLRVPVPGLVRTPARAARALVDLCLDERAPTGHHGGGIWGREAPAARDPALGAALWEAASRRVGLDPGPPPAG